MFSGGMKDSPRIFTEMNFFSCSLLHSRAKNNELSFSSVELQFIVIKPKSYILKTQFQPFKGLDITLICEMNEQLCVIVVVVHGYNLA